jgi:Lrp/AsnC family transcriptional regulator for asnA, asnC and gidA
MPKNVDSKKLDDRDWQIIDLLRSNGRYQNKQLAKLLRVSEPTIASRIDRLREDGIILVTVQQDLFSQGFKFQCVASLQIRDRDVDDVATDLAQLSNVSTVTLTLGSPEIIILFNARGLEHVVDFNDDLAAVPGIFSVDTEIVLRIAKYESVFANLARPFHRSDQLEPAGNDLDQKIITALRPDGRSSNREVARRLGLSEATVRQRIKKLQKANKIRIGVVMDVVRTGFPVSAWVRLSVQSRFLNKAVASICNMSQTTYVARVSGRLNVLFVIFSSTHNELLKLLNANVRTLQGVEAFEVRTITKTAKHDYYEFAHLSERSSQRKLPKKSSSKLRSR